MIVSIRMRANGRQSRKALASVIDGMTMSRRDGRQ
jgi:hypothetical protein